MTRKEGVYSFTVYCDQAYLEKIKTSAKDSNQKLSAFVLGILDQHFGLSDNVKQVSDNLDIEAMIAAAIDAKLSGFKASVNDEFLDMKQAIAPLLSRLESLESDRSEVTAPANFMSALHQKVKGVAQQKMKELPQVG